MGSGRPRSMWRDLTPARYTEAEERRRVETSQVANNINDHSVDGKGSTCDCWQNWKKRRWPVA